ncbi:hypothetical protein JCM5353_006226 [Sporobolomyces roseus]
MQRSPPSTSHLAAPTPPSSFSPHPISTRSPLPFSQQRQPPPPQAATVSVRTQSGITITDPVTEARRSLALLVGNDNQGGGLLDTLQVQVERALNGYERAFEEQGNQSNLSSDLETMYSTLDAIISLLSRSSLGGYSIGGKEERVTVEEGKVGPGELERAQKLVQGLFREVQRCKEGGEIVRAGLTG